MNGKRVSWETLEEILRRCEMTEREKRQEWFEMRKLRSEGWTLQRIADKFGYTVNVVARICRYETHVHGFF